MAGEGTLTPGAAGRRPPRRARNGSVRIFPVEKFGFSRTSDSENPGLCYNRVERKGDAWSVGG